MREQQVKTGQPIVQIQSQKVVGIVPAQPSAEFSDDLLRDVMDSMEQCILVWDAQAVCTLVNVRVFEMLELESNDLYPGMHRTDFLRLGVERGEFSQETADKAEAQFERGEPFVFERAMPSGRSISTNVRPRDVGGFVVTFSDISRQKEKQTELSAARDRAETAETELADRLLHLSEEKAALEQQQDKLARLSMVATHAKDLIVITGSRGQIEWVNKAFSRAIGYQLNEVAEQSLPELLCGSETDPASMAEINECMQNRQVVRSELQCYRQSQQTFWMELEVTPVFSETGEHTNFIAVGRDTTARRVAQEQAVEAREYEARKRHEAKLLAEFNEWLQSTDSLDELFAVVSAFLKQLLPESAGAVYVYANSRDVLEGVCNWNDGKMVANFEPPDCWALRRGRSYFYGENAVDFPCRHVVNSHAEEQLARHYCLPIIAHGDTVGLLCVELPDCDDAEESREAQKLASFCAEQISLAIANVQLREQLTDQSTRDGLTSLFNRRYFIECIRRELNKCSAENPASVISFDVDHFKKFNDNYGHDAGDTVLRTMSQALLEQFRSSDIPCRYGGEEFVIFLPGASADVARLRAEELRCVIENTKVRYSGEELAVTISSGIATFPANGNNVQTLIKSADKALYAAKEGGRNTVRHYEDIAGASPDSD